MRTTVNIHDGLLETVKQRAKEQGTTLGDVIEEALQRYFLELEADEAAAGPPLPVFQGPLGLAPGVDLSTNAGLYEVMHAEEDAKVAALARGDELP